MSKSDLNIHEKAFVDNLSSYVDSSLTSAQEVISIVQEMIKPNSVVDVGCSVGTWLSVWKDRGVSDIAGIDGPYVDTNQLRIPKETFHPQDLRQPIQLDRNFDLAMSLEVAEHLPEEYSKQFVESLTKLSPVVLFSAAIPLQGGTGHVNEQWQEYWAELFSMHGFKAVDCIRGRVWQNPDVSTWYKQNVILFVESKYLDDHPNLLAEQKRSELMPLSVVHPRKFSGEANPENWDPRQISLDKAIKALRFQLKRKFRGMLHWRLQRLFFW